MYAYSKASDRGRDLHRQADRANPAESNSLDSGQKPGAGGAQNLATQHSERGFRRASAAAIRPQAFMERNFMAPFSFTDDLYTGSSLIDGDHRKLIDFVNAFFQSMQSGKDDGHMSKAMNALIAYTGEHFAREEAEMERIRYVAALAHQAEHAKLLKQLIELKEMLDAGGRMNIPAVADFLSGWLRDHILTADKNLAAALK
jgi:hemerythrin-like metal-binding protein